MELSAEDKRKAIDDLIGEANQSMTTARDAARSIRVKIAKRQILRSLGLEAQLSDDEFERQQQAAWQEFTQADVELQAANRRLALLNDYKQRLLAS